MLTLFTAGVGVLLDSNESACRTLGLIDDEDEWVDCMREAADWQMPSELRDLFVCIMVTCVPPDSRKLYDTHEQVLFCFTDELAVQKMAEDIVHRAMKEGRSGVVTDAVRRQLLVLIDRSFRRYGRRLSDYPTLPQVTVTDEDSPFELPIEVDVDALKAAVRIPMQ